ncbi:MAG: DNA-binding protein [Nanoarchaeota archaeon]|nr:DNA-binding protein [Nanoarchaeota archaeon]
MNVKKLIKELKKQEKIKLVEPNENVSKSYLEKSRNSLKAGKILLSQNLVEESISMSYYGMYNKLLSLLYKVGIKSENHFFSIFVMKEVFNFENKEILFAKKERINKQYYANSNLMVEDAKEMVDISEDFCDNLGSFINRVSIEKVKEYRNKFLALIK